MKSMVSTNSDHGSLWLPSKLPSNSSNLDKTVLVEQISRNGPKQVIKASRGQFHYRERTEQCSQTSVIESLKTVQGMRKRYGADIDVCERVTMEWEVLSPKEMHYFCSGSCC